MVIIICVSHVRGWQVLSLISDRFRLETSVIAFIIRPVCHFSFLFSDLTYLILFGLMVPQQLVHTFVCTLGYIISFCRKYTSMTENMSTLKQFLLNVGPSSATLNQFRVVRPLILTLEDKFPEWKSQKLLFSRAYIACRSRTVNKYVLQ